MLLKCVWALLLRSVRFRDVNKRTRALLISCLGMSFITIAALLSYDWFIRMAELSKGSTLRGMDIIKLYDSAATTEEWLNVWNIVKLNDLEHIKTLAAAVSVRNEKLKGAYRSPSTREAGRSIAIGCAITSRGISDEHNDTSIPWENRVEFLPFFRDLLPSFCRTASVGYNYHFYVAHDYDDPWFSEEEAREAFSVVFASVSGSMCRHKPNDEDINVQLKLVTSEHSGKPARAQNDALMEAYREGKTDFFYRVNDDTCLGTPGWTEIFIGVLLQFQPPLVGVVGPSFSARNWANYEILTYEFVHRTHVDIFKFYYPSLLTSWYADDWITRVYQPGRCVKVSDVKIVHTQKLGRRYETDESIKDLLLAQIRADRATLLQWIQNTTSAT